MRQYVSSQRNFIEMLKNINCYGHLWKPFARIQRAVNLIREHRKRNRERETPPTPGAPGAWESGTTFVGPAAWLHKKWADDNALEPLYTAKTPL